VRQIEDSIVQELVRRKPDLTAFDYYGDQFSPSDATDSTADS